MYADTLDYDFLDFAGDGCYGHDVVKALISTCHQVDDL